MARLRWLVLYAGLGVAASACNTVDSVDLLQLAAANRSPAELPSVAEARRDLPRFERAYLDGPGDANLDDWKLAARDYAHALEQLGRNDDVLAVYRSIATRDPQDEVVWNDVGIRLSVLGRDREAEKAFARGIPAPDAGAWPNHGPAFHYLAKLSFEPVLEIARLGQARSAGPDDWMTLYGAYATRGRRGDVERFLQARAYRPRDELPWPQPLVERARNAMNEAELVAWLQDDSDPVEPGKLCEALYFEGLALELAGKRERALRYYEAAIATRVTTYLEYMGARRGIQRLRAGVR